jgi:hypothetical protein
VAGTFQQIHLSGARRWVYDRLGGRYAYEEHVRAIGTRAPILTGWIVLVATLTPADDKTARANNGMIWISGESETTKGFQMTLVSSSASSPRARARAIEA